MEIATYQVLLAPANELNGAEFEHSSHHGVSLNSPPGDENGFYYPGGRSAWPSDCRKFLLFPDPAGSRIQYAPHCFDS